MSQKPVMHVTDISVKIEPTKNTKLQPLLESIHEFMMSETAKGQVYAYEVTLEAKNDETETSEE